MTAARADMRLAGLGAAMLLLVLAGLALHQPDEVNIRPMWRVYAFVGLIVTGGGLYAVAIRMVLHAPPPRALLTVLVVAAAMRIAVLPALPFLSSDVYRYVWDGRVQVAGVNPYSYVPADPVLTPLRDAAIYPNVNRRDYARTIYPPMAQLIFRFVAGISDTMLAMKAAMVGFEVLAFWAMMRLLALLRLPRARVLIYAWNPLGIWTFAGNGHVDAAVIGLLSVALLLRAQRRPGFAGAVMAAAALVKFLPVVLLPAVWRRWDWRLPAAFIAGVIALYAIFIGAGWHVLGFLPGYGAEEGLNGGNGFFVLALLGPIVTLPGWAVPAYLACSAGALAALALRFASTQALRDPVFDARRACLHVAVLAAAVIVIASPHYPWYFVWLALPCCVAALPSIIYLSVAPAILYLNPWDERVIWPTVLFLPFVLLAVLDLRRHLGVRQGRPACRQPA